VRRPQSRLAQYFRRVPGSAGSPPSGRGMAVAAAVWGQASRHERELDEGSMPVDAPTRPGDPRLGPVVGGLRGRAQGIGPCHVTRKRLAVRFEALASGLNRTDAGHDTLRVRQSSRRRAGSDNHSMQRTVGPSACSPHRDGRARASLVEGAGDPVTTGSVELGRTVRVAASGGFHRLNSAIRRRRYGRSRSGAAAVSGSPVRGLMGAAERSTGAARYAADNPIATFCMRLSCASTSPRPVERVDALRHSRTARSFG